MAADYTTFVAAYPEFAGTAEELVKRKLEEAVRQLEPTAWGTLLDDGTYLLAAQKLARTPFGNAAKLSATDGRTVYDAELDRMRQDVASGYRVT